MTTTPVRTYTSTDLSTGEVRVGEITPSPPMLRTFTIVRRAVGTGRVVSRLPLPPTYMSAVDICDLIVAMCPSDLYQVWDAAEPEHAAAIAAF